MLFKRNKVERIEDKQSISDKVAGKIARVSLKVQTKFADTMNRKFSALSLTRLKVSLFAFCVICGGYSLFIIGTAILKGTGQTPALKIDAIKVPRNIDKTGDESLLQEPLVDEETYRQVNGYILFMDSLQEHNPSLYDSITLARPGLMDSISILKDLYEQNNVFK